MGKNKSFAIICLIIFGLLAGGMYSNASSLPGGEAEGAEVCSVSENVLYGDVNGDEIINVTDAVLVLRYTVDLVSLDKSEKNRADVNNNGEVDVEDAILILRYIVGLINEFPVQTEKNMVEITILHTNDIHGRVEEGRFDGMGFDRLAAVANDIRKNNPHVMLLDAGDTFHGMPIATVDKGEGIVEIMNAMGYDAMTVGNHDFNYGQERLTELAQAADFPLMGANIIKEDSGELFLPDDSVLFEFAGIKVAVFGLTTPETKYRNHPAGTEGLEFTNPVTAAQTIVPELRADGADIVIALTHLSTEGDWSNTKLAQEVAGIDLIITGHSHEDEGMVVNGVPIASAHEYGKKMGVVTLSVNTEDRSFEWTMETVTKEEIMQMEESGDFAPDPEIRALIDNIRDSIDEIMSEVIGTTAVRLNGDVEDVRKEESNLGSLITDVMLHTTGAQAAFMNGGGIRASVEPGEITKGDIITILPFGNMIVTLEIKGEDLLAALEHSVTPYPELFGGFLHVSGLTFLFDPGNQVGERITEVLMDGEPLDPEAYYTIATNDFLAAGGDAYNMLKESELLIVYFALDEALIDYISDRGEIAPVTEGRIIPIS